jgi:acetaldehyde dehydrogenase (acetylating)
MSSARRALRVGIIGTGNIGTDLMFKVERSPALELAGMAGIDPDSDGSRKASGRGHIVTSRGLPELLERISDIELVFDATSAAAHPEHARLLAEHGIRSVDLTPAALGPAIVPPVNLSAHRDATEINLVTCGAQATVPIVAALRSVGSLPYAETVSTVASRSAGPGTRQNIDEFTSSTARALETVGGATQAKAIIILNPANPPVMMRNTIYAQLPDADADAVKAAVLAAVEAVQRYVPGYRLVGEPLVADGLATVFVEVEGAGDHLPPYAGNLDIMTAAAVRVAELYAEGPR